MQRRVAARDRERQVGRHGAGAAEDQDEREENEDQIAHEAANDAAHRRFRRNRAAQARIDRHYVSFRGTAST